MTFYDNSFLYEWLIWETVHNNNLFQKFELQQQI